MGLLGADLQHQPVKTRQSRPWLCAAYRLAGAEMRRGEVGDCGEPLGLVLDQPTATVPRRGGINPATRLDRRPGVGADHHVAGLQELALPIAPGRDRGPSRRSLGSRDHGEDPRADLPRLDRILGQSPADHRRGRVAAPRLNITACSSERLERVAGMPCSLRSSREIALTCATASRGNPLSARTGIANKIRRPSHDPDGTYVSTA